MIELSVAKALQEIAIRMMTIESILLEKEIITQEELKTHRAKVNSAVDGIFTKAVNKFCQENGLDYDEFYEKFKDLM